MALEAFERLPEEKKEKILSVGIKEFSQKSYREVSTDTITQKCEISKGLLFHYFGSKKNYYLYCLNKAMKTLTEKEPDIEGNDFYEILFAFMSRKIDICIQYRDQMYMVNMASRDPVVEVAAQKNEIMQRYKISMQEESANILKKAAAKLKLKNKEAEQKILEGLQIYINALMNIYLVRYQKTPDLFLENSLRIKEEIREYLDLMLYGICEEHA